MTEKSVHISITIKVAENSHEFRKQVKYHDVEEGVQSLTQEIGQQALQSVLAVMAGELEARVPRGWKNIGTEKRTLISSLGVIEYKRRVYLDENQVRRKPMDETLGIQRYSRMSGRVQEMGSYLASSSTYRRASEQLSWLIKTSISQSAIQRMVWSVGNRIADGEEAERKRIFEQGDEAASGEIPAPILFGESDGVWVHLQREKRKSAEVRVAILNTGRKPVGKGRFRLENKVCLTALGLNSEEWQEHILREAHLFYDLESTKLLVSGGDGNQWVRHSFDRFQVQHEFVLDRFHLHRAARRAFRDRGTAWRIVSQLRQHGFCHVQDELDRLARRAAPENRQKIKEFYQYVFNNQDGLLDLEFRGPYQPAHLGAIEGNVDKLVVHRMKGRGCSWRLSGLRAMLALCRNADLLKSQAFRYLPIQHPTKKSRHSSNLDVQYSEVLNCPMPIFNGPHQNRPWVKWLHRSVHGR
jgi:hypothetical protein